MNKPSPDDEKSAPDDLDPREETHETEKDDAPEEVDSELVTPIREKSPDFGLSLPGTPITDYERDPERDEEEELKEEEDAE